MTERKALASIERLDMFKQEFVRTTEAMRKAWQEIDRIRMTMDHDMESIADGLVELGLHLLDDLNLEHRQNDAGAMCHLPGREAPKSSAERTSPDENASESEAEEESDYRAQRVLQPLSTATDLAASKKRLSSIGEVTERSSDEPERSPADRVHHKAPRQPELQQRQKFQPQASQGCKDTESMAQARPTTVLLSSAEASGSRREAGYHGANTRAVKPKRSFTDRMLGKGRNK